VTSTRHDLAVPFLLLVLLLGSGACASVPWNLGTTQASVTPQAAPDAGTLYARDGSVVSTGAQPGREPEPRREIGQGEGSRVYLLELYQKSMDEKNALAIDVENLRAALDEERRLAAVTGAELEKARNDLVQVTKERDELRAQAFDLAARVTTSQIARLEAEKAWLELKIDVQKREEEAATRRVGGPSRDARSGAGGPR